MARKAPSSRARIATTAASLCSTALLATVGVVTASGQVASAQATPGALPASTKSACAALVKKYPSVAQKTITVGISAGAGIDQVDPKAPYGFSGLNPTFTEQILNCLDDKPKFTNYAFDGLIPSLTAHHVQMVVGSMYDTAEREKQVAYVDYLAVTEGGVVAKGNPKHIKTMNDLCGKTAVETAGEIEVTLIQKQSAKCVKEGKQPVHLIQYTDGSQVTAALLTHRADFELNGSTVAYTLSKQYPGKLEAAMKPVPGPIEGIQFQKGETALIHAIAGAVAVVQRAGLEMKGVKQYLGPAGTKQVHPTIKI